MINHIANDLYLQDGVKKQLIISYDDGEITNNQIHFEKFSLTESISAETELKFGGCEASMIEFRVTSDVQSLKDKWLTVSQILNDDFDNPIIFGYFKVYSDKLTADKKNRDIQAYDAMFYLVNTEISEWYNGFMFPVSLGFFRKQLFKRLGLPEEDTVLPFDDIVLRSSAYIEELYAGDVLKDICALNGRFGIINRDGIFRYVKLKNSNEEPDYTLKKSRYQQGKLQYEDYTTEYIEGVYLKHGSSGTSVIYGMGYDNLYPLELTTIFISDDIDYLREIAYRFYEEVKNISYTPYSVTAIGNPCIECGDKVDVVVNNNVVMSTYVLERKLSGIQNLTDEYTADGTEYYEYLNSSGNQSVSAKVQAAIHRETLGSYTFTNATELNISKDEQTIVLFNNIGATSDTEIIFMATIPIIADNDGNIIFNYEIDAVPQEYNTIYQYINKGYNTVTLVNYFKMKENARMTLGLTARTEYTESTERQHTAKISALEQYITTGNYTDVAVDTTVPNCKIIQEGIKAVIFAKGITKGNEWDGTINIAEQYKEIDTVYNVDLAEMTDTMSIITQEPDKTNVIQTYSEICLGGVEIVGMNDTVQIIRE